MTKTFFSSLTFQIKYLYENGKPQLYEGMNQIFGKTYKHYSPHHAEMGSFVRQITALF